MHRILTFAVPCALAAFVAGSVAYAGPTKKHAPRPSTWKKPKATAKKSQPSNGGQTVSGKVLQITTETSGEIRAVALQSPQSHNFKFYRACGMKLRDVPHLTKALGTSAMADLYISNDCIRSVNIRYPAN